MIQPKLKLLTKAKQKEMSSNYEKTISVIAIILSMVMVLASCGTNQNGKDEDPVSTPDPELVKNTVNATIELEDGDEIMLELYPDLAPDTVENFVELAEDGFYDGTIFHRVIEDFMIQGGGYDENLKEQKTESIKGEFAKNGFENTLSHTRGVISMARAQDYDSATSQFFIVQKDATYLDGQYAAFGRVTEGMDIVDEIASVKTGTVASSNMEDVPIEPIVIDTITIDTSVSSGKSSKTKATQSRQKIKTQTRTQKILMMKTKIHHLQSHLNHHQNQQLLRNQHLSQTQVQNRAVQILHQAVNQAIQMMTKTTMMN